MYESETFLGFSINFQDICLVYPPLIKDIVSVGYETFLSYIGILTKTQEEIDDNFVDNNEANFSPFIFLMTAAATIPAIKNQIETAISFFVHEKIMVIPSYGLIVVGDAAEKRVINADNFFDFQNLIRAVCAIPQVEKDDANDDPRLRHFKALQRKRDAVKAKANSELKINNFSTFLTSICCMDVGLNPLNIKDVTYGAVMMLVSRYYEKDRFESSFAISLSGGESKNNDYWVKDIN